MKQTKRKPLAEVCAEVIFQKSLSEDKQNCYDK